MAVSEFLIMPRTFVSECVKLVVVVVALRHIYSALACKV